MPNLSGSGGRSSGVNYATAAMFDRMYWSLQNIKNKKEAANAFAYAYQANTGAGAGSLKRLSRYVIPTY